MLAVQSFYKPLVHSNLYVLSCWEGGGGDGVTGERPSQWPQFETSWFLWITYFILIFSIIEWLRWSFASKLTNNKPLPGYPISSEKNVFKEQFTENVDGKSSDSCRPQKVSGASQHSGRRRPVLKCKQQTSWNKMARHSSSGVIQLWGSDMKNVCEGTLS